MKIYHFLFFTVFLFSCTNEEESVGLVFDQESFDTNRELWESSGITNYAFTQVYVSNVIGGQNELRTYVVENSLDTIYVIGGDNGSVEDLVYYESISEVYDYIDRIVESCEEEINSSDNVMEGAKIIVEYNDSLYFPTKISCTGIYPEGYDGGLGVALTLSDFEVNDE